VATLYSSSSGSSVKWMIKGSSVESEILSPLARYLGHGFLVNAKNSLLLDSGDIAMPSCLR